MGQRPDDFLRGAMGQAAEDEVYLRPVHLLDLHQIGQVQIRQMREDLGQRLAGLTFRRQDADIGGRVAGKHANQFGAGVTTGSQDGDPDLIDRFGHLTNSHRRRAGDRT